MCIYIYIYTHIHNVTYIDPGLVQDLDVCARPLPREGQLIHMYAYIYIYIYICMYIYIYIHA